jgi:TolB-like protein
MGIVYEAEDTTLGRRVALKFLPEQAAKNPTMLARLQREARAASALNHPNICTIYAVEQSGEHYFISMELLEGVALDHLIAEKSLTNEQIIDLGLQICDALEAAHGKGIIHRDIKPANIFVTHQNRVKVLDFGLAKMEELLATTGASQTMANPSDLNLTHAGTTMGTVAYMSPEQARAETLDARTDIFSFGVVLYQMATGKVPFEGTTSAVVFSRLLEHAPVSPAQLNPGLPSQLDGVIGKALEKDRTLRYQTIADVSADLRRLKRDSGASRAVTAAMPAAPPVQPAPAKPAGGMGLKVAVAAIALVALLGAGLYWARTRRAPPPTSAAAPTLTVMPFSNIGDANNSYLTEGITNEVSAKLAQLPGLHVEPSAGASGNGAGSVLSGSVVRSGDAVVVNTELVDNATHQSLWNHQYTAKASELQALEGQLATDIAEHAGVKLGWEERQRLQAAQTTSPDAYLQYLEARHDIGSNSPNDASKAADLLNQALQKDPNFTAAADALAELRKQSPDAAQSSQQGSDSNSVSTNASSAQANAADKRQKHPSIKSAAASPVPAPPTPAPAPAAPDSGMGKIAVQSQPAGASIFLDGKDTGKKTPAQIEAARGMHTVVVRQEGYLEASDSANVTSSASPVTISQTLTKLGETKDIKTIGGFKKIFGTAEESMGRIRIETTPKGAKVTVGSQVISKPTPVEFALNPGNYQIKLELDGYETVEKVVEVSAGKKVQLKESLAKK